MATLTITSSNWDVGQIRITYTASNGTFKITEIEGKRGGGYHSYNYDIGSIDVSVDGTSKSVSISKIDFGDGEWIAWSATDTTWTGITDNSVSISTTMPSGGSTAFSGAKFSSSATMSWSTYTITYNANGGSLGNVPSTQTKTHGTDIKVTSAKPTKTGYTFLGWSVPTRTDVDEKYQTEVYYSPNETIEYNGSQTLKAVWQENYITVNLYSNYATYGTYEGVKLNVSGSTNVVVYTKDYLYDNSYSDGLSNVQNEEYLYLSRTGYTATGKWGTSTSGGTLLDQTTSYTGKTLAEAVGKSLASGNATINLYAQWKENVLTVNYYSNYATGAFDGALNEVASNKNVHVYTSEIYYDNDYSTYGLANYSNSAGSVYMTRTGYTATGKWGTSTSGGTLLDEDTTYATGQAIAKALGKDISNGDASINVYAQWRKNVLTMKYHVNGGVIDSDTYYTDNGIVYFTSSSSALEDDWEYNSGHTNGLYNASTFGLSREGYDFVGWKVGSSGTTVFDQDDNSIIPTDLASNLTTGDRTITLYAVWKISGVVYIDDGSLFEPYLIYIDNGTSWDLYMAYIDNGTDWIAIS